MKKNPSIKIISLIAALVLIILLSIELYNNGKQTEDIIGGERDEHGCLGSAGYTWSEEYGLCVREWELDETDKKILQIEKEKGYLEEEYGLTFIKAVPEDCAGCFSILLDTLGKQRTVGLYAWDLINLTLTPQQCLAKGGYPLNVVAGDDCKEDEKNIAKVVGFISPNICCVPDEIQICTEESRQGDVCITLYEPVCGYPLELTFSNGCLACQSEQIEYYIKGVC